MSHSIQEHLALMSSQPYQPSLTFRKYPSTTALQCFESAARHLSFTKAAQELHLTQSAVSKQVAQLEAMLNMALFYRTAQRISLTPAGKDYYVEVVSILQHLETATTSLMTHSSNKETLKIVAHPTLCARWLIPALRGFNHAHPLIHLDIKEHVGPFFLQDHQVDLAFLFGDGVWSGMEAIKLFDERCVAVCRPEYLADFQDRDIASQDSEADTKAISASALSLFKHCVLLQLSSRPSAWYEYFEQQSISFDGTFVGPRLETFYACISAALSGMGVALVPRRLVAPELAEGSLVLACDYTMPSLGAYYLAYPLSLGESYKLKVMLSWIKDYLNIKEER